MKWKVITFTGAGGKTTAMFALAKTLIQSGKKVIITTTTKIENQVETDEIGVIIGSGKFIFEEIRNQLKEKSMVIVGEKIEDEKIHSLALSYISPLKDLCDYLLIEGDGSRRLPLKFPKNHEPVVPPETELLIWVAGGMSIGKKIKEVCYHPLAVASFLKKSMEDEITFEDIMALGFSSECGRKGLPPNAAYSMFISKMNQSFFLKRGIAAIILAGGESKRMGQHKLLMDIHGKKMLEHVLDNVRACHFEQQCIVLGYHEDQMIQQISLDGFQKISNPQYREGQATSLIAGLSAFKENLHKLKGIMVFLGDMPFVKKDTIEFMIKKFSASDAWLAVPFYKGRRGNPVIIGNPLFPEIFKLQGDMGARYLFQQYENRLLRINVTDEGILKDIDIVTDIPIYKENDKK